MYKEAFWRIMNPIKEYHTKLGYPKPHCTGSERIAQHRDLCLALVDEVMETLASVPWKPWRPEGYAPYEIGNLAEELVDVIFFVVSLCETWDITPDHLSNKLTNKLAENERRISAGYNKSKENM